MATSRRVARVAELIKREVSTMLLHEIKDDRVGMGMTSVTAVEVSGDLQHAKIFVSIYGTEEARIETMEGLESAKGFVRRELGQRLSLRRTPEILFKEDRSFEEGTKVLSLINKLSYERAEKEETEPEQSESEQLETPAIELTQSEHSEHIDHTESTKQLTDHSTHSTHSANNSANNSKDLD
ncbi:Ribosome-binding factor A [Thalassoporum mexicanum PCC 7367]|nr:30S ribosome-binding factor RbfA [Pseudanabaena sp. PCC 7367]AFY68561.1 Ribosome-binding factor A [Pseudanabaena sp. PCC 7367]